MKTILIRIGLIFCLLVMGGIIGAHIKEKSLIKYELNGFLKRNNYSELVIRKELKYDLKMGKYYMKVIFKDEPQHIYDLKLNDGFYMFATDKSNTTVSDPSVAKYTYVQDQK